VQKSTIALPKSVKTGTCPDMVDQRIRLFWYLGYIRTKHEFPAVNFTVSIYALKRFEKT
jgi:hypothetical protein